MTQPDLFDAPAPAVALGTAPREGDDSRKDLAVQCRDCTFWKALDRDDGYFRAVDGTCKHHGAIQGWWTCGQFQARAK